MGKRVYKYILKTEGQSGIVTRT